MKADTKNLYHLKIIIKDYNAMIWKLRNFKFLHSIILHAQREIIGYTWELYTDQHPQIKRLVHSHFKLFTESLQDLGNSQNEIIELLGSYLFGDHKTHLYDCLIIKGD